MPERYTPTTAQVCEGYAAGCHPYRDLAEAWFHRWLDQQLAAAWDEGHGAPCDRRATVDMCRQYHPNPYEGDRHADQ